ERVRQTPARLRAGETRRLGGRAREGLGAGG
ncbi:MAG: hypothetical protein AVDCRST_MAG90-1863, partial [uncultured Microvirga sp.]